jgi:glycine cleavage system H protein
MTIPNDRKYSKDHEWIRMEGETGTIGITDYAQGELGDIVFVELPAVGSKVEAGKAFGTIEAVKAVSDLYAPVSGEVIAVNKVVQDAPETVNKDPYGLGWMIQITLDNHSQLASLLDADGYQKLIGK